MKGVIVGAGRRMNDLDRAKKLLADADVILCADGGYDYLAALNVEPDIVLGDFDSLSPATREKMLQGGSPAGSEKRPKLLVYPPEKDDSDLELALRCAVENGVDDCVILGGTGSRFDHSLCNILLAERFTKCGMSVELIDDTNRICFLPAGVHRLAKEPAGWYCSFLARTPGALLSLRGFEYELVRHPLPVGTSLGISNHIRAAEGEAVVEGDGVFCIFSCD
ncbi:MAG: thiamine diphosphokinase [Ndongobacter sp.]|nr:thiamine diphosphokinase [Ndongobacter sp.]